MNEQNFMNLTCRVMALEYLLTTFASDLYKLGRFDPEKAKERHQRIVSQLRELVVPGVDPAMSDHLAAELQTAAEGMLQQIEANISKAPGNDLP